MAMKTPLCVPRLKASTWVIFGSIYRVNLGFFLSRSPYKLASTVRHRKGKVAGVTDWEGQRPFGDEVAKLLSLCQSFCHTGGPWMQPATQSSLSLPSNPRSASGKLSSSFFIHSPPAFLGSFIWIFTSWPFSVHYFLQTALERTEKGQERGKQAKKVWNFFIGLGTRHMVLWTFLHSNPFPCFASHDFLVLGSSSRLSNKQICLLYLCPLKCLCVFDVEKN